MFPGYKNNHQVQTSTTYKILQFCPKFCNTGIKVPLHTESQILPEEKQTPCNVDTEYTTSSIKLQFSFIQLKAS